MPGERPLVARRIPLATPFGRQVGARGGVRGPLLSVVAHLGLIAALIWSGERAMDALRNPGDGAGKGGGGGGGGNRAFAVLLPAAAAAQVPELPVPEPDQLVVPKTIEPLPVDTVPPSTATASADAPAASPGEGTGKGPGSGTGTGGGTGSGTGTGVGSGVGPDSGGSGRIFPPQPQGIILPPGGAPGNLRGVRLTVRFDIGSNGSVLGVEVEPAIRDRGYRNEFMERMRRYTFTAAYGPDGRTVRAIYQMEVVVQGR
jgi:protein TonB